MTRPVFRVDFELAYCAWLLLAPEWVARYPAPALSPWFQCVADAVRAAAPPAPDDAPLQHLRRAILRGATPEQPFPSEVRGKALLVISALHELSAPRLAELGAPGAICRALGPAVTALPASRSA